MFNGTPTQNFPVITVPPKNNNSNLYNFINDKYLRKYYFIGVFKFGLPEADWYTSLDHFLGKVKKKIALLHPQPVLCGVAMCYT